jgi:hypothetical protein
VAQHGGRLRYPHDAYRRDLAHQPAMVKRRHQDQDGAQCLKRAETSLPTRIVVLNPPHLRPAERRIPPAGGLASKGACWIEEGRGVVNHTFVANVAKRWCCRASDEAQARGSSPAMHDVARVLVPADRPRRRQRAVDDSKRIGSDAAPERQGSTPAGTGPGRGPTPPGTKRSPNAESNEPGPFLPRDRPARHPSIVARRSFRSDLDDPRFREGPIGSRLGAFCWIGRGAEAYGGVASTGKARIGAERWLIWS